MNPLVQHQMQPCKFSCVATCLAMLLDEPVSALIPLFHQPYRSAEITLRTMLEETGIVYTSFYNIDEKNLGEEGAYLCTVPSLNIQAGNHQVIVEVTDENYFILDPVMGRDAKYYVSRGKAQEPNQVEMAGFVIDAFISRSWLEGKREWMEGKREWLEGKV